MNADALALPPIERVTLNELAYQRLKRALLSGRIEPGTTLTLRQLAAQLGTSMMPVRESITRLSAENALEVLPNRGIVVPYLESSDAEDIWSLRIQLEGDACARAARRAGAAQIEEIGALCRAVRVAAEAGDLYRVLECNSDFQFAVYQAAASPVLLQLIEVLRMKSVPHCTAALRVLIAERPDYYERSWEYHDRLVEAIADGDAPRARRAKRADLREFRDFVNAVKGQHT
ncbi:MAG TPA: GntR family transcriptional regulator [Gammaproteobacteria bacterium]|jgi:DNA-binding GntR family transcriptional regulator|nr:GntR family transcriptional regulator [Gammaproteobacteria bacterium]